MYGDRRLSGIVANSALFVSLYAIGSWISLPFGPVPITLQTLFVLLSGAVMKRYALVPATLYLVMGSLGLPVFHNGTAGVGMLLGPTGGYIIGFIPAAAAAGLAYERESSVIRITGLILATFLILGLGSIWLMFSTGRSFLAAFLVGTVPFIIGDCLKAAAAYAIASRLERFQAARSRSGNGGARREP